jgi:hypothetical protein
MQAQARMIGSLCRKRKWLAERPLGKTRGIWICELKLETRSPLVSLDWLPQGKIPSLYWSWGTFGLILMCQVAYLVTARLLMHPGRTSVSYLIGPF